MLDRISASVGSWQVRSFVKLAAGASVSVVASLVSAPFITRLFSPSEFGMYSVLMVGVGLFGPVICLKYDMAIVVAESDAEASSLTTLCLVVALPLSLVIGFGYAIVAYGQFSAWQAISLAGCAMAVLLLLEGLNNTLTAHNNRDGMYGLISSVSALRSVVTNAAFLLAGVVAPSVAGLATSQIIGSAVGSFRQSRHLRQRRGLFRSVSRSSVQRVARVYVDQARYNAISTLVSLSAYSAIALLIRFLYSADSVGNYALSYRVLGIPFALISANASTVFFRSAAREYRASGKFRSTFSKALLLLAMSVLPSILLLALVAPPAFAYIFGPGWHDAGDYVRLLAPMFAAKLIAESLTTSFIVAGRQNAQLAFQVCLVIGELLVFVAAAYWHLPIQTMLVALSGIYAAILTCMIWFMFRLSGAGTMRD